MHQVKPKQSVIQWQWVKTPYPKEPRKLLEGEKGSKRFSQLNCKVCFGLEPSVTGALAKRQTQREALREHPLTFLTLSLKMCYGSFRPLGRRSDSLLRLQQVYPLRMLLFVNGAKQNPQTHPRSWTCKLLPMELFCHSRFLWGHQGHNVFLIKKRTYGHIISYRISSCD